MGNLFTFLISNQLFNIFLIIVNSTLFWILSFRRFKTKISLVFSVILLSLIFSSLFFPPLNIIYLFVIIIIYFRKENSGPKIVYQAPKAVFEGGGIRRGLTPPEAAGLLGKPLSIIISLTLMQMLKKGFINFGSKPNSFILSKNMQAKEKSSNFVEREKSRRELAQKINAVLTPYEELVIEFLEQNSDVPIRELNFEFYSSLFSDYLNWRIGGYDIELSIDYYEKIINRSHIEVRSEGILIRDGDVVIERNLFWVLLSDKFEELLSDDFNNYFPKWFAPSENDNLVEKYKDLLDNVAFALPENVSNILIVANNNFSSVNILSDIARATRSG